MQHRREVERWQAQVVHSHDWHAALVANYLKTFVAYTVGHIATVFTIHHLAYQGQCSTNTLALAEHYSRVYDWAVRLARR